MSVKRSRTGWLIVSKAGRQTSKKFAQSLVCQNEGELDIRGARSTTRHPSVRCTLTSPQYATKVADRLTKRSQLIATFPHSGRVVPEANNVNIREVIEGPYRIIYHILEDEIDVIAVVHGARSWPDEP